MILYYKAQELDCNTTYIFHLMGLITLFPGFSFHILIIGQGAVKGADGELCAVGGFRGQRFQIRDDRIRCDLPQCIDRFPIGHMCHSVGAGIGVKAAVDALGDKFDTIVSDG